MLYKKDFQETGFFENSACYFLKRGKGKVNPGTNLAIDNLLVNDCNRMIIYWFRLWR